MARKPAPGSDFPVYLEIGAKRVFAVAPDWPGWCRSGRDEAAALQALLDYAPRYARAVASARLGFKTPRDLAALRVIQHLPGNATTDFGAPGAVPKSDSIPLDSLEARRARSGLRACWIALERAVARAAGVELRKGPRGGGRPLQKIVDHCLEAEETYLARIGLRAGRHEPGDPASRIRLAREDALAAFDSALRDGVPNQGPRGGKRWAIRTYLRRSAWHLLDHAWEIEDRAN